VQRSKNIVAYDVNQQVWEMVAQMPDAILAIHVQQNELRDVDKDSGVAINE